MGIPEAAEAIRKMEEARSNLVDLRPGAPADDRARLWAVVATAEYMREIHGLLDSIDRKQGEILGVLRAKRG